MKHAAILMAIALGVGIVATPAPDPPVAAVACLGDVDADGRLTSLDAVLILQFTVGLVEPADWQTIAADVSGNGEIGAYDAALVLRYSMVGGAC
ncbi:MAG: dockerin type I repeat-containing protein [Thermoanaerobaculia bacterium]|jgi:hypothetical protein